MQEEATIEKEASAPLLEQIITENNIQGVLLSLNEDLIREEEYLYLTSEMLNIELEAEYGFYIPDEIYNKVIKAEGRNKYGLPHILTSDLAVKALNVYFDENIPIHYYEYKDFVIKSVNDWYTSILHPVVGAKEVLYTITLLGKPFLLDCYGEKEWIDFKIDFLSKMAQIDEIPYYTEETEITDVGQRAANCLRDMSIDAKSALMIGSNIQSSIIGGVMAGCRNFVWIKGDLDKLPPEIRDDQSIHIWCVDSVDSLN